MNEDVPITSVSARTRTIAETAANEPSDEQLQRLIEQKVRQRLFAAGASSPRIGRYLVLEQVGKGGMGTIYAAYDEQLDRKVAVKVLRDDELPDEADRLRFQREAQALARLSHPNVVTVHEVGESDGEVFLAMEFIRGDSVAKWLHDDPPWQAVLEVFVQAGAGLFAAHEAGLVHRDLKPHNIMRGEDGVVKVVDFGLARTTGDELEDSQIVDELSISGSISALNSELTRPGTVMGTPPYMSPEQLRGETVDERSDQFSFCVALYQALYGHRPFEANTLAERLDAIVQGRFDSSAPISTAAPIPRSVRRALARGLAAEPDRRWPSMAALVAELRRPLAPPRWKALIALGGGIGLVGLAAGYAAGVDVDEARDRRCTGAAAQLEGIWDVGRRARIEQAMLSVELPHARDTWERVGVRLDEYASAWIEAHTEACEATTIRGELSQSQMDLRMGCLQKRRRRLRATVDELARADAQVMERAVMTVAELPGLTSCTDVDALAAERPLPDDPAVARQVTELDDRLVAAEAKYKAGRYAEAMSIANAVAAEAESLAHEPLQARAWLLQGALLREEDDHERAVESLRQAYVAAVASGMDAEAARAASSIMSILGAELEYYEDAHRWALHADPLSRAVGSERARARFLENKGALAFFEGQYDEAREIWEQALAARESSEDVEPLEMTTVLNGLAMAARTDGRLDEARVLNERVLTIREEALGPRHPRIAHALFNLGALTMSQGKLDETREHFERALAIIEDQESTGLGMADLLDGLGSVAQKQGLSDEARRYLQRGLELRKEQLGPRHPRVAGSLNNIASAAYLRGELEMAREAYEQALAIREEAQGPDHPEVASLLSNLSAVATQQGRYDDARQMLERSLTIVRATLGPEHPEAADSFTQLAILAVEQGDEIEARAQHERALTIRERVLGLDHPRTLQSSADLGSLLVSMGEPDEAIPLLERVLAATEPDDDDDAELRFDLARALWDASTSEEPQRQRARMLAEQARDILAAGDEAGDASPNPAEIGQWLARHEL